MRSLFSFMISLTRLIVTRFVINHLIKSLPPRPVINNSTPTQTPQPFPRTVQTSALPNVTEPTQRVQLQSGTVEIYVFRKPNRSHLSLYRPVLCGFPTTQIKLPDFTLWSHRFQRTFQKQAFLIGWIAVFYDRIEDNGQYLIFEQSPKKRNSTSRDVPSRSESFPRGENRYSANLQSKRRSGQFEMPEYSTPVSRESSIPREPEKKEPVSKFQFCQISVLSASGDGKIKVTGTSPTATPSAPAWAFTETCTSALWLWRRWRRWTQLL